MTTAAAYAGFGKQRFYSLKAEDKDFAEAWELALQDGVAKLEQELHRRAVLGVEQPVIRDGQMVWIDVDPKTDEPVPPDHEGPTKKVPLMIREYSDRLLELLLKHHNPAYRERSDQYFGAGALNVQGGAQVVIVPATADPDEWQRHAEQVAKQSRPRLPEPAVLDGDSR